MKKVDNIRLAKSSLTDNIYAGFLNKAGNQWLSKIDITNDFLKAVIDRFGGYVETIDNGEEEWEITVKKISKNTNQKHLKEDEVVLQKYQID